MKRFYLAGQRYFGNRGCEALVRTTVQMLRDEFGEAEFLTPSIDASLDRKQWPEAEQNGVRFVKSVPYPAKLRWWYRLIRLLPLTKRIWLPTTYTVPSDISGDVLGSDAVIMIGGDNFSLDYTVAGLLGQTGFSEVFMRKRKPMILWAASVGPFSADPVIERYMRDFLNRLDLITVRETATLEYLRNIGVTSNVHLVTDPAFLLNPQPISIDAIDRVDVGAGLLGLNVSPLIDDTRYGRQKSDANNTAADVVQFIEHAVRNLNLSVILLPHVDPLGHPYGSSDTQYLTPIFERVRHLGSRVALAPSTLNAAELKYTISKCRYFIGARTHSTIASLSSGVPTISIAYSVKARGLNRDLFGHERYVLPTPQLSLQTLIDGLKLLIEEESDIRALLQQKIPTWQDRARLSAQLLAKHLT